jgi:hypothetical protein
MENERADSLTAENVEQITVFTYVSIDDKIMLRIVLIHIRIIASQRRHVNTRDVTNASIQQTSE